MVSYNLIDVDYHLQNVNSYCGPACAQMILSTVIGDLVPDDSEEWWSQCNIDDELKKLEIGARGGDTSLFADPEALKKYLNNTIYQNVNIPSIKKVTIGSNPVAVKIRDFRTNKLPYDDNIAREIAWTIFEHKKPVPVLRYIVSASGDKVTHWVVVRGFSADRNPKAVNDKSYSITAFYIYDPFPGYVVDPKIGKDGAGYQHRKNDCRGSLGYLNVSVAGHFPPASYSLSPQDLMAPEDTFITGTAQYNGFTVHKCAILPNFAAN
jgi:hypothetical protein